MLGHRLAAQDLRRFAPVVVSQRAIDSCLEQPVDSGDVVVARRAAVLRTMRERTFAATSAECLGAFGIVAKPRLGDGSACGVAGDS